MGLLIPQEIYAEALQDLCSGVSFTLDHAFFAWRNCVALYFCCSLQVDEQLALACAAEAAAFAREGIEGIEGVRLLGASGTWGKTEDANGMAVDPLRLTCDVSGLGLSGAS